MIIRVKPGVKIDEVKKEVTELVRRILNRILDLSLKKSYYWSNSYLDPSYENIPKESSIYSSLMEIKKEKNLSVYRRKETIKKKPIVALQETNDNLAFSILAERNFIPFHQRWLKVQSWCISKIRYYGGLSSGGPMSGRGNLYEFWFYFCHDRCVDHIIGEIYEELKKMDVTKNVFSE